MLYLKRRLQDCMKRKDKHIFLLRILKIKTKIQIRSQGKMTEQSEEKTMEDNICSWKEVYNRNKNGTGTTFDDDSRCASYEGYKHSSCERFLNFKLKL